MPSNPNSLRFGEMPMAKFRFKAITTLKERIAKLKVMSDIMYPEDRGKDRQKPETPEAGNSVVRYIRAVLEWTKEFDPDLIGGHNWGHDVNFYPSSVTGWLTWGPDQCSAFEATHAQGTKARLLYDLARLTGQRKGDIARLGPAMVEWDRRGREHLKSTQAKGRNVQPVTAYVPITPPLKQSLDAARAANLLGASTFIAQENGKPYTAESPRKSVWGLLQASRAGRLFDARLEENGCRQSDHDRLQLLEIPCRSPDIARRKKLNVTGVNKHACDRDGIRLRQMARSP